MRHQLALTGRVIDGFDVVTLQPEFMLMGSFHYPNLNIRGVN